MGSQKVLFIGYLPVILYFPTNLIIMSASPMARQLTGIQSIPVTRRVVINHEHEMPTDYGTTPGGTMFAHTPGGTRIVYERAFLMQMRQSPLAKTPPANLPLIPGVTVPSQSSPDSKSSSNHEQKLQTVKEESPAVTTKEDDAQFDMEV